MIVGLSHTSYTVSNLKRTMAFYGGTLGIEHTHTQVSDQPYLAGVTGLPGSSLLIGFARVEGDISVFEVIEYMHPKGGQAGIGFGRVGMLHLCWSVDNLSAAYERLLTQGVTFMAEPHLVGDGPWGDALGTFLLDPDGLFVELIEPAEESSGSGRLTGMHHTTFTVSNLDAALDLLCGKLGLKVMAKYEGDSAYVRHLGSLDDAYVRAAYLAIPNTAHVLQVWEFRTQTGPPANTAPNHVGSGHLCFMVDDIMADYEALTARDIQFVGLPTEVTAGVNKGAYAVHFLGPDSIRLELFQGPPTRVT